MDEYFSASLFEEKNRIQKIFKIFTFSFFSRAVFYVAFNTWYIFFSEAESLFLVAVVFDYMYLIWDVYPLTIIMRFHYESFTAQVKQQSYVKENHDTNVAELASESEFTDTDEDESDYSSTTYETYGRESRYS